MSAQLPDIFLPTAMPATALRVVLLAIAANVLASGAEAQTPPAGGAHGTRLLRTSNHSWTAGRSPTRAAVSSTLPASGTSKTRASRLISRSRSRRRTPRRVAIRSLSAECRRRSGCSKPIPRGEPRNRRRQYAYCDPQTDRRRERFGAVDSGRGAKARPPLQEVAVTATVLRSAPDATPAPACGRLVAWSSDNPRVLRDRCQ